MAQGTLALSTGTTRSPSMPFTATIASAKPTWASCGVPATMSPTAHTPSTPVRWYSSVTTKPRSLIRTPTHRHDDGLDVPRLLARLHRRHRAVGGRRVRVHPCTGDDVDAALLERA